MLIPTHRTGQLFVGLDHLRIKPAQLIQQGVIHSFEFLLKAIPLVFFAVTGSAQNHDLHRFKIIHGVIRDNTTSKGISNVYIRTPTAIAVSDNDGNFLVRLSDGDSIYVSHVSYTPHQTRYNGSLSHGQLVIVLSPRVTVLREITVKSLPTESEFRTQVLETIPQLSKEEEIAQENVRILNQASKFAMPIQMDSYQSYRDYMKGPQGVVIFSSNGSKGLVRAIKNLIRSSSYKFPSSFRRKATFQNPTSLKTISPPTE